MGEINERNVFLCPMGTCPRCDEERRREHEARCPLLPPKHESTLARWWRWFKLGSSI